jgi:hypothetical protein
VLLGEAGDGSIDKPEADETAADHRSTIPESEPRRRSHQSLFSDRAQYVPLLSRKAGRRADE